MAKHQKYTETERDGWLAKWRASGQSVATFAARNGLNKSTLYRWIELFGSERSAPPAPAVRGGRSAFTEVRVRSSGVSEAPAAIEIALPGGRVVRVHGEVDAKQLRVVLDAAALC